MRISTYATLALQHFMSAYGSYDRTFATYMRRLKRLLGCSLVPRSVLIYRSDRFLTIIFRDRLTNSEWCLCG